MNGRALRFLLFLSLLARVAAFAAVTNPPVITSLSPKDTVAGTGQVALDIFGANFVNGSIIRVNGVNHANTQFIDATHLHATLGTTETASAGTLQIVVANPNAGGISSAVAFAVLPNNPQITSLSPSSVFVNTTDFTVQVKGQNFASTAKVRVNNSDRDTTFIDSSTLSFLLTSADVATARTLSVTVLNPNTRTSNTMSLPVTNGTPAPVLTVLSPDTVTEDSGQFTLTVFGNNFVSGAQVQFNGVNRATTFVSATKLTATIFAADITNPGTAQITVRNPDGKTSGALTLTILAHNQPTLQSISPSTVNSKGSSFTLTATGTNFLSGARITVGSTSHAATFVNSTTLTTTVSSAEIAQPAQLQVTVTNPGNPALTSSAQTLTVVDANAPVITGLNPASVVAGSGSVKVLINGSGFTNTDVVLVNNAQRPREFVSANQLAVTLQDTDVATAGQLSITVQRTTAPIATSAPATLNVTDASNGAPVIQLLTPSTAALNGQPFTLRLTGSGFTAQSVVSVDGSPRATTYVDPTQLTIPIFASDLTAVRQIPITVVNPGQPESVAVTLNVAVVTPVITALSPAQVIAGDAGFTLNVIGTGFDSSAIININGQSKATIFDPNSGGLSTSVLASDIANTGSLDVTVTDRGVTSAVMRLNVVAPLITSLSPSSATAGSAPITLVVQGNNFLPSSVIVYGGVEKQTTYTAATGTLSATLTTADLAQPVTVTVLVRNSAGAQSAPAVFTIVSPGTPSITSLSPAFITAGAADQTLTIRGINFLPGSIVAINGGARPTTFVSATELHVNLAAAELATPGTMTVTVTNPDATTSAAFTVTITPAQTGPPPARRRAAGH